MGRKDQHGRSIVKTGQVPSKLDAAVFGRPPTPSSMRAPTPPHTPPILPPRAGSQHGLVPGRQPREHMVRLREVASCRGGTGLLKLCRSGAPHLTSEIHSGNLRGILGGRGSTGRANA